MGKLKNGKVAVNDEITREMIKGGGQWGESGFNCWEVRVPALVLFLFYVNISGMRP